MEPIQNRKREHVALATSAGVTSSLDPGWGDVHLVPAGLPTVDLTEITLDTVFLGREFRAPLVISALTGGFPEAAEINASLVRLAAEFGLMLELGSQRAALHHPELLPSYLAAREAAPDAFVAANIGLSQLIPQPNQTPLEMSQLVEMVGVIRADALVIHLNYLQEALQTQGDTGVQGALEAVAAAAKALPLPVIVKETGSGIPPELAKELVSCGASALDSGGAGGTSMALLEAARAASPARARLGRAFGIWGIPSAAAVASAATAGLPLIGSGGIRSGLDAVKALALGADLVGVAQPWLAALKAGGEKAARDYLTGFLEELKLGLYLAGARNPAEMKPRPPVITGATAQWLAQLSAPRAA